jgi:hypothetical protein
MCAGLLAALTELEPFTIEVLTLCVNAAEPSDTATSREKQHLFRNKTGKWTFAVFEERRMQARARAL